MSGSMSEELKIGSNIFDRNKILFLFWLRTSYEKSISKMLMLKIV